MTSPTARERVASGDSGSKIEGGLERTPVCDLNVNGLHAFVVGETQALAPNTSGADGMPRIGRELGRGAEGVVYDNLDQPGWVVKEYHQGGVSPFQARNEFQNLERARAVLPDNVVKAQAPADPRQGFLVKEQVISDVPTPADRATLRQVEQDFINGGIQDVGGNLMFGHTADNPTHRWILIE